LPAVELRLVCSGLMPCGTDRCAECPHRGRLCTLSRPHQNRLSLVSKHCLFRSIEIQSLVGGTRYKKRKKNVIARFSFPHHNLSVFFPTVYLPASFPRLFRHAPPRKRHTEMRDEKPGHVRQLLRTWFVAQATRYFRVPVFQLRPPSLEGGKEDT
jgi:hypothetical protein